LLPYKSGPLALPAPDGRLRFGTLRGRFSVGARSFRQRFFDQPGLRCWIELLADDLRRSRNGQTGDFLPELLARVPMIGVNLDEEPVRPGAAVPSSS